MNPVLGFQSLSVAIQVIASLLLVWSIYVTTTIDPVDESSISQTNYTIKNNHWNDFLKSNFGGRRTYSGEERSARTSDTAIDSTRAAINSPIIVRNSYCHLCQTEVSRNSKHCRECDKCVDGFDHHCRWLNNCIGRHNYRSFLLTLFFGILFLVVEIAFCLYYIISPLTQKRISRLKDPLIGVVSVYIIISCGGLFGLSHLFGLHLTLRKKRITTYEHIVDKNIKRIAKLRAKEADEMGRGATANIILNNSTEPTQTKQGQMSAIRRRILFATSGFSCSTPSNRSPLSSRQLERGSSESQLQVKRKHS